MAKTKNVLQLTFGRADMDKKTTINIASPKAGLTDDQVKTTMQNIIAGGALGIKESANAVDQITSATYVKTLTEEIAL